MSEERYARGRAAPDEDTLLQYDPYAAAANGTYNFPSSINYDWDVPVDTSRSSTPALPGSLEGVIATFGERPFGMMALLSGEEQARLLDYLRAAAANVDGFLHYADQLKESRPERYEALRDYVLHGPGADDPEHVFVRAAEALLRYDGFQEDFTGTLQRLEQRRESLGVAELYGRMKEKEYKEVRITGRNGHSSRVVPVYALHAPRRRDDKLDETLSRAG